MLRGVSAAASEASKVEVWNNAMTLLRSRPFSPPTLLLVELGVIFSFTVGAENVVVQLGRGTGHLHPLNYAGLGGKNLGENIVLAPTENERSEKVFELVISCDERSEERRMKRARKRVG